MSGKILAIDYGTKNIGLAISDNKPSVALPWQTITITNGKKGRKGKEGKEGVWEKIFEDLEKLVQIENIGRIIIGMPLNSTGDPTKLGDEVFKFAKDLGERLDIPVEVIDERFTSKMATGLPHKTSRNIHELSAQILLQEYIDKLVTSNQ